jgi:hypothetical protein
MRIIASIIAISFGLAFSASAFAAGDLSSAKGPAACHKVGGVWWRKDQICSRPMAGKKRENSTRGPIIIQGRACLPTEWAAGR